MDFKKQEALSQGDFKTPFSQKEATFPIGREPLLATSVNFTALAQGALRVEFQEVLPQQTEKRSFQVTLVAELLHGFMHLYENALQTSAWRLGDEPSTAEVFPGQILEKPPTTYLN